ncbi:glycosyltransferase family 4 protein [Halomonas maura]|uniref:glycosyltransferase family 4 protein n=1 Tax=Halomonas maura TaxID=117606 RepID=UPI0025B3FDBA|nr:glycosyltransferase family 4 protein [Halomonas maura]MDN3554936.1 glycosyltransferase family 4 protein [Halomonas maura]
MSNAEESKVAFLYQTSFAYKKGGIQQHIEAIRKRLNNSYCITAKEVSSMHFMGQYLPYNFWKRSFRETMRDVDTVHAHGFANAFTYAVLIFLFLTKRKSNFKLLYTPHAHELSTHRHPKLLGLFVKHVAVKVLNRADKVICLTDHERIMLESYGVRKCLTKVIPNGHLIDGHREAKNRSGRGVLFIGRDAPNKKLSTINELENYFKKSKISVTVVSDVREDRKVSAYKYFKNLPLQELKQHIRSADVLVVPSTYESFGLVVLESLACGTPVVVSDKVMIKEYIEGYDFCEVAEVDDLESFSRSISFFLDMPNDKYFNISEKGIKFADTFTWDNIVNQHYKDIY